MNQKLQELTDKIYQEGVQKAEAKAAQVLAEAEAEAHRLVAEAEKKAAQLTADSEATAEEMRRNVQSELKLSAEQAVSGLKQELSHVVTTQLLSAPLKASLSDVEFVKQLIEAAVRNWNPQGATGVDLQVLLPEAMRQSFDQHFADRLQQTLQTGLNLQFQGRLKDGFRIGPADGRFLISFTSEDFDRFFRQYLREQTSRLLFDEQP